MRLASLVCLLAIPLAACLPEEIVDHGNSGSSEQRQPLGFPCSTDEQCGEGQCSSVAAGADLTVGVCTLPCGVGVEIGSDCPSGACLAGDLGEGVCLAICDCASPDNCAVGFTCQQGGYDLQAGNTGVCVPDAATGFANVTCGAPCQEAATRCFVDSVEQCHAGEWMSAYDCGLNDMTCAVEAGGARCDFAAACNEGEQRCRGNLRQSCVGGVWNIGTDCSPGCDVCVQTSLTVAECQPGACSCTEGETRCAGTVPELCDGGIWFSSGDCATSGYVCRDDMSPVECGPPPTDCVDGAQKCVDNALWSCVTTGWILWEDCGAGSSCIQTASAASCELTTVPCTTSNDCTANEYCRFPTAWEAGVVGYCDAPCLASSDCDPGQGCSSGICYTNGDCAGTEDCPPGEVCAGTASICSAPPASCSLTEQCPTGWICDANNSCLDPTVGVGDCAPPSSCAQYPECGSLACECINDRCVPTVTCVDAADCLWGFYCSSGVCMQASACTHQDECAAYSLVCEAGYCIDPAPCVGGQCQTGYECKTTVIPNVCLPIAPTSCTGDLECAAGQYCDLFYGECQPGCRDSTDCGVGQCNGERLCTTAPLGAHDDPCVSDNECASGSLCMYGDATIGLMCELMGVTTNCEKSCRMICDTQAMPDPCPAGMACVGSEGVVMLLEVLYTPPPTSGAYSYCQ